MVMRFPAKKNAGCPKAPHNFPPRQDSLPPRQVALGLPSPPRVCTDGRAYADVRIKISRIDWLPNFRTHGVLLARFACGSSAIKTTT